MHNRAMGTFDLLFYKPYMTDIGCLEMTKVLYLYLHKYKLLYLVFKFWEDEKLLYLFTYKFKVLYLVLRSCMTDAGGLVVRPKNWPQPLMGIF